MRKVYRFFIKASLLVINGSFFWSSRLRRQFRGVAKRAMIFSYLDRYKNDYAKLPCKEVSRKPDSNRIFSIWFQGEEHAPAIVKACFRGIRENCSYGLSVLDESNLNEWIHLPEFIIRKREEGKISYAQFSDLCRLELLSEHGGLWMDSTDFVVADIPQWIWDEDFFLYLAEPKSKNSYSGVQSCFIRAKSGNPIIRAWRDAVWIYWQNEENVLDYFIVHLILMKLVECNLVVKKLFDKMPKRSQYPTHVVWKKYADKPFDKPLFMKLTQDVPFQKTSYRTNSAKNPIPGSFADAMINMW